HSAGIQPGVRARNDVAHAPGTHLVEIRTFAGMESEEGKIHPRQGGQPSTIPALPSQMGSCLRMAASEKKQGGSAYELNVDSIRTLVAHQHLEGHLVVLVNFIHQAVRVDEDAFLGLMIADKSVAFRSIEKRDRTATNRFLGF